MTRTLRTVVFVHGLWMTGHESLFLRRELKQLLDAEVVVFSYRSVVNDVAQNALELCEFLRTIDAERIDLVGHSLGGLVILRALESVELSAPGRVVLLGSPLQGCETARSLSHIPFLKAMLGRGIEQEAVKSDERQWTGAREIGVIAGDLSMGMARLVASLTTANDGTVLVSETRMHGTTDHIVLPVSHTGMVFSGLVGQQTAEFLRNGRFLHSAS